MAHPFNAHRAHHVERNRVSHILGKSASTPDIDNPAPRPGLVRAESRSGMPLSNDGMKRGGRLDKFARGGKVRRADGGNVKPMPVNPFRPPGSKGSEDAVDNALKERLRERARGGKVKKGTTVNVVIAGQGDKQPMPVPVPVPGSPAGTAPPPPRPPMPPPGAGAAPGGPPMPPPGIRRHGGRAFARGGSVKPGPAWEEGRRNGTQVTHSSGKNDSDKINTRPALLTRKRGGRTSYPLTAGADSGVGRLQLTKAQRSFKAP